MFTLPTNVEPLIAGAKMLLGMGDPKEDFKDSVAKVNLS